LAEKHSFFPLGAVVYNRLAIVLLNGFPVRMTNMRVLRRGMTCLFVFVSLSLRTIAADDKGKQEVSGNVQGWRAARWGMTEDQVLAAFPNEAKRVAKLESFTRGSVRTLEIETVQVANRPFSANLFEAKTKQLKHINLTAHKTEKSLSVMFPAMERALTEQYGKPDVTNSTGFQVPGMKRIDRWWNKGATLIVLQYDEDPRTKSEFLLVSYSHLPVEKAP
jgi:hypothetical protein